MCHVTQNGDGSATLTCPDGSSATFANEATCSVTDHGDGTATLACNDGTSVTVVLPPSGGGDPSGGDPHGGDPVVGGDGAGGDPVIGGDGAGGDPVVPGDGAAGDPVVPGDGAGGDPVVGGDGAGGDPVIGGDADTGWPAATTDYVTQQVSWIDTLTVPAITAGVPECCKDFGPISEDFITTGGNDVDNAYARLAASLAGLGVDLQASLDTQLQTGDDVPLLDHRGLAGTNDDFVLAGLRGAFEGGTDYLSASSGNGTFLLHGSSFVGGTGEPRSILPDGFMDAAFNAAAGPGVLYMATPFAGGILELPVRNAEVSGLASFETNGIAYTGGVMSGWLEVQDIFDATNAVLTSDECACLGLSAPVYVNGPGGWSANCVDASQSACGPDQRACAVLAGNNIGNGEACPVAVTLFSGAADLDLDGDPAEYEALSLGLHWTAAAAQVVGFVDGACAAVPAGACADTDPCTIDGCDPATGLCTHTPAGPLGPCDDGDACTSNDVCTGGVCAGTPMQCDDDNPCTDDACSAGVCVSTDNTAPCDDGDACTAGDSCEAGACVGVDICPSGENCIDPFIATVGTQSGDTTTANNDFLLAQAQAGSMAGDQVYLFTPAITGDYTFTLYNPSTGPTLLYVVTDCSDVEGTVVGAYDFFGGGDLVVSLIAGMPVFLIVDGWGTGDEGPYDLTIVGP